MEIQKITVFAVVAALLSLFMKQVKSEWSQWIGIAAGILVALYIVSQINSVKVALGAFDEMIGTLNQPYQITLWKAIGVTYLCEIAADVCRETGNHLLSKQVEISGKLTVLLLGLPLLLALYEMLMQLGG